MTISNEDLDKLIEIKVKLFNVKKYKKYATVLGGIIDNLLDQRAKQNKITRIKMAGKRKIDKNYGRGAYSTLYLVQTKLKKVFWKGTKSETIDYINRWEEFEFGRKMPKSYNLTKLNQILAERCGEWTSPKGIMGIYKIITEKEIENYV